MSFRGRGGYHRGGGRGRPYWQQGEDQAAPAFHQEAGTRTDYSALRDYFNASEGGNYGQLRSLTGASYQLSRNVTCTFISIQPDPFAPGSQVRISCPCPFSLSKVLENAVLSNAEPCRRVAAEDYILRAFHEGYRKKVARHHSGAVQVLRPSQHVLERSTVMLVEKQGQQTAHGSGDAQWAEVHLFIRVKLPGHGRRIDGRGAIQIIYDELLPIVEHCVVELDQEALYKHVTCVHDQENLRSQLRDAGYVAFVANGAILPRDAGNSDKPLRANAVPFQSPKSLECSFRLPHSGGTVTGMGLRPGLTLIAGGGFHGKSTLLRALEVGVYNHVPDDGRVYVVVDPTAVKIRAEDRRSVHGVDISPFINNLPFQKDTTSFATSDASGSTSQATNIMEALELGSQLLLLDEDTCATNLMYRDGLMQALVPREQEPITPFVERVEDLSRNHSVSSIMVVGGSGQYFPHANVVLVMKSYQTYDCTSQAKEIASSSSLMLSAPMSNASVFLTNINRRFDGDSTFSQGDSYHARKGMKVSGVGTDSVRFADETIDLSLVEQIVEEGQVNAIAQCLALLYDEGPKAIDNFITKGKALGHFVFPSGGCGAQYSKFHSDFSAMICGCSKLQREARLELRTPSCYIARGFTSAVRHFEIGAALNRLRTLRTITSKCR
ncbi:putative ATPase of the ABC class [Trypanosoma vivax]|uniref:Mitochondrial RNA binding complex 1 subunit n=1 Tax=Trypanosoma vivax (strain Y486) TaxID=1055687 RepID=G0TSH3_TRYVY|nr:hypothetical protein TRVL_03741 [Trypanosoma vivax]KAH8605445.1 putative ATPase of the ABC class [Trypanosoma vivax]CCC46900.1 conserved hypothetical protein [Trypanosoma vivax Y486]